MQEQAQRRHDGSPGVVGQGGDIDLPEPALAAYTHDNAARIFFGGN
jgi:hypothetical protein